MVRRLRKKRRPVRTRVALAQRADPICAQRRSPLRQRSALGLLHRVQLRAPIQLLLAPIGERDQKPLHIALHREAAWRDVSIEVQIGGIAIDRNFVGLARQRAAIAQPKVTCHS